MREFLKLRRGRFGLPSSPLQDSGGETMVPDAMLGEALPLTGGERRRYNLGLICIVMDKATVGRLR